MDLGALWRIVAEIWQTLGWFVGHLCPITPHTELSITPDTAPLPPTRITHRFYKHLAPTLRGQFSSWEEKPAWSVGLMTTHSAVCTEITPELSQKGRPAWRVGVIERSDWCSISFTSCNDSDWCHRMGDIEIKERIDITAGIIHQNIINDIQIFTIFLLSATVQQKKNCRSLHWVPGQCQVLTGALELVQRVNGSFRKENGKHFHCLGIGALNR